MLLNSSLYKQYAVRPSIMADSVQPHRPTTHPISKGQLRHGRRLIYIADQCRKPTHVTTYRAGLRLMCRRVESSRSMVYLYAFAGCLWMILHEVGSTCPRSCYRNPSRERWSKVLTARPSCTVKIINVAMGCINIVVFIVHKSFFQTSLSCNPHFSIVFQAHPTDRAIS